jgi:hypothetical protein
MIYSDYSGFGVASPVTKADCPPGGDVGAWCDCMWPAQSDPGTNSACKSTPLGGMTPDPWTDLGAATRGIPNTSGQSLGVLASIFGGGGSTAAARPGAVSSLMSLPTMILIGGSVIAAGALGFYLWRRRRRGQPRIAGYRRRKRKVAA